MSELWRPSPISPERFEVSDQGHVRERRPDGTLRMKTLTKRYDGYLVVGLGRGPGTQVYVHRLVAMAFPQGDGPLVRHLDGDQSNNTAVNLRWGTSAENNADMLAHGTNHYRAQTACKHGHVFDEANTYWRNGYRSCRACNRHAQARRRIALAEASS